MAAKIASIINIFKSKIIDKIGNKYQYNNYLSSNSNILKMYYNFGTMLCFTITTCIFYNIFMSDQIICSDGFGNYDKKIKFMLVNYCLSYPELPHDKNKERKFALFYKWVPWITSLVCFLLYSVKIMINNFSCNYTAKTLSKIVKMNDDYVSNDDIENLDDDDNNNIDKNDCINYLQTYIDTQWNKCKSLYFRCLLCHIYAFVLNISLFFLLDFLLQGRFLYYIPDTFPFYRDPINFSDKISQFFYPFVKCTIKPNILQPSRQEDLTCHLTLMEYYEKIFFMLWIFFAVLLILNFIYIIYLLFLWSKNYNRFLHYLLKKCLDSNLYSQAKININIKKRYFTKKKKNQY